MNNSRRNFAILAPLAFALAACGKTDPAATSKPSAAAPATVGDIPRQAPNIEAIEKYAKGFDVGQMMSQRRVYVFFDPQCGHCAALWFETHALRQQARFTWIPVALLGNPGIAAGAEILLAADPTEAMQRHASAVMARDPNLNKSNFPVTPEISATIMQNTKLLENFGASGVPFIVAKNQQTGAIFSKTGGMPSAELAVTLGW